MQHSKYGKAYCIAPNFSKEEALPVGSQLCSYYVSNFRAKGHSSAKLPLQ